MKKQYRRFLFGLIEMALGGWCCCVYMDKIMTIQFQWDWAIFAASGISLFIMGHIIVRKTL